jgi:tetratricopeptide (TPR) repeat protein
MSEVDPPFPRGSAVTGSGAETTGSASSYDRWRERGKAATLRGDFRSALDAYQRARQVAEREGDRDKVDRAAVNVAMVLIQMGEARKGEDGLREILLRSRDQRVGFTAAYNLASSLRKQGRYERALAYARRALERAEALNATDLLAGANNLLGNILLSQSYLDEALERYDSALALRETEKGDTRYSRATLLENIGYCMLLQGRLEIGLERIRQALALAEEVGDNRCHAECLQDLCYGLLLVGKHKEAIEAGVEALASARLAGYAEIEENCHYLLGELGSRTGDMERRDRHFERLQALHPELPFLKDFLCAVDVTRIITLKR